VERTRVARTCVADSGAFVVRPVPSVNSMVTVTAAVTLDVATMVAVDDLYIGNTVPSPML
jgi:hypothetical protein